MRPHRGGTPRFHSWDSLFLLVIPTPDATPSLEKDSWRDLPLAFKLRVEGGWVLQKFLSESYRSPVYETEAKIGADFPLHITQTIARLEQ